MTFICVVHSLEETAGLASRLAALVRPGDVICLRGDLGAGKTTFARALAMAIGTRAPVSSPTFTLIHEYHGGRLPVYHADAYRLRGPQDLADTGLDDYLVSADGVVVLEWPERIESALPPERLDITLVEAGLESRRVTLEPRGASWNERIPLLEARTC